MLLPVSQDHHKVRPHLHSFISALASHSITHPILNLLPQHRLSYWLCSKLPQGYCIRATSRLTVSKYLLYLVVPPFGFRLEAIWLSLGRRLLWLSLEVSLLRKCPIGTRYKALRQLFPMPFGQFRKHLKTSLVVSEDTSQGRELLWYRWRYINTWLQLGPT